MKTHQHAQAILIGNPVFLDTETTGFENDDQIIEIAIIDANGKELINKLVKANKPSHPQATETHGLSDAFIATNGEDWNHIWPEIHKIFSSHNVCIYNSAFDVRMLKQTCEAHDLTPYNPFDHDIMELANRHFIDHAIWDTERSQFKRLSLARCCEIAGITYQGNAHRAIVDCHAMMDLLKFMANDTRQINLDTDASNDDVLVIEVEA